MKYRQIYIKKNCSSLLYISGLVHSTADMSFTCAQNLKLA